MIIDSDTIRNQLTAIWQRLQFMVLSDPQWWLPDISEVRDFMAGLPDPEYIPRIYECEEIALDLVATQRRWHAARISAGEASENCNWPLGIVCGTRFRGRDMDHWQNLCGTRSGLVLIEPQTKSIWQPDPAADQIYFLLM